MHCVTRDWQLAMLLQTLAVSECHEKSRRHQPTASPQFQKSLETAALLSLRSALRRHPTPTPTACAGAWYSSLHSLPSNRALRACAAAPGSQGGRAVRGGASAGRPWTRPYTRPAPWWRWLPRTDWRGRGLNQPGTVGRGVGRSCPEGVAAQVESRTRKGSDESIASASPIMCLPCLIC